MEVGSVLSGKYRLVRQLGDGGMGTVYEARHEVLGTSFAVKVLHADLARRPGLVERFMREAHVAAQIKSPHVVQVFDVERSQDGTAFIVMELLGGEPLSRVLDRERRLPPSVAVNYTLQILAALEAAHALNVVHRDLKPENVFVVPGPGGAPLLKLIDFGIAKLRSTDPQAKNLTAFGVVMGTPEYMAPEQAFSADRADARSDIFAVGVLLYEMLAGARPASGDDAQTVAGKVHRGEVIPLVHAAPQAPRELAGLVHRAMAPRPELRFQTATEMANALRALAQNMGSQSMVPKPVPPEQMPSTFLAPPLGSMGPPAPMQQTGPSQKTAPPDAYAVSPGPPPYQYTPPPPPVQQPSFPEPAPPRRRKKSRVGLLIAIPLLLGAIGAVVFLAVQEYQSQPPPIVVVPPSPTPVEPVPTAPATTAEVPTTGPLPTLVPGTTTAPNPTTKPTTTKPGDAGPAPSTRPSASGPTVPPPIFPPFPSTLPSNLPFPIPSAIPLPSGFPIPSGFPLPPGFGVPPTAPSGKGQ